MSFWRLSPSTSRRSSLPMRNTTARSSIDTTSASISPYRNLALGLSTSRWFLSRSKSHAWGSPSRTIEAVSTVNCAESSETWMVTLPLVRCDGDPSSRTSTVTLNSPGACGTQRNCPLLASIVAPVGDPEASAKARAPCSGSVPAAVNSTGDPATALIGFRVAIVGGLLATTATATAFHSSEVGLPLSFASRPSILASTSTVVFPGVWLVSVFQAIFPVFGSMVIPSGCCPSSNEVSTPGRAPSTRAVRLKDSPTVIDLLPETINCAL